jgi:hypothetical protein
MAVKQIGVTVGGNIKQYTGLTADTAAWIAPGANTNCGAGSTYRELDGQYRLYEFQSGTWYLQ